MYLTITFLLSGAAIIILIGAKLIENRLNRPLLLMSAISKGDGHIRALAHSVAHHYSETKERLIFFLRKQLPLRSRNLLNKLIAFIAEKTEKYIGNIRDSRLIKKHGGISEFFRSISEVERGAGEISEGYEKSISYAAVTEVSNQTPEVTTPEIHPNISTENVLEPEVIEVIADEIIAEEVTTTADLEEVGDLTSIPEIIELDVPLADVQPVAEEAPAITATAEKTKPTKKKLVARKAVKKSSKAKKPKVPKVSVE